MKSRGIDAYVRRDLLSAFLLVTIALTMIIWLVQVLNQFELVTSGSTTAFGYIGMTSLLIPALLLVIAPIALVIAAMFILNRLHSDSELVVLSAGGFSPWRIFRPFLKVGAIVAAIVAVLGFYLAPKLLRELRVEITAARYNLVATVAQPGRFLVFGGAVTLHMRERRPDGSFAHVLIDDRRNPEERLTITAQTAEIREVDRKYFMIFYEGTLQRLQAKRSDPSIVQFKQYAFDLNSVVGTGPSSIVFNVTERGLGDLIWPDENEPYFKSNQASFSAELHQRIVAVLYPLVFIMVAFAAVGAPRSNRQGRLGAIIFGFVIIGTIRLGVHALMLNAARSSGLIWISYGVLFLCAAVCAFLISRGVGVSMPESVGRVFAAARESLLDPVRRLMMARRHPAGA